MKKKISKRRVQQYLDELVALAKTVTPDVEFVSHIPGDEGQHAWLKLYVPDELEEQIDDLLVERIYDIFNETGYDIAAIAYEKSSLQNTPAETENGRNGRQ
jgi:hypothetical protein